MVDNIIQQGEFSEIRRAIEFHLKMSERKKQDDEYRVDRYDVVEYFAMISKWKLEVMKFLEEVHDLGEKVLFLDICGRATGYNLGADISYCFSIENTDFRKILSKPRDNFFDGDIFNSNDFSDFLNKVSGVGIPPALVTFAPMAGLTSYYSLGGAHENISSNYKEVTHGQLEKRLHQIVDILKPGGYIYIENPPFNSTDSLREVSFFYKIPTTPNNNSNKTKKEPHEQETYEISLELKRIAKELDCGIKITPTILGPGFLIRKPYDNRK